MNTSEENDRKKFKNYFDMIKKKKEEKKQQEARMQEESASSGYDEEESSEFEDYIPDDFKDPGQTQKEKPETIESTAVKQPVQEAKGPIPVSLEQKANWIQPSPPIEENKSDEQLDKPASKATDTVKEIKPN